MLTNTSRKTEITNCYNCTHFIAQNILEKVIFLECLHQIMIFKMGESSVGYNRRVLNYFVIGIVCSGDFEFIVVSEIRGGIDLLKE